MPEAIAQKTHFGILCPPISGHLNPMCALGRALQKRGHRVSVVSLADLEPKVRAEGLEFIGLEGPEVPRGALSAWIGELGRKSGLRGALFSIRAGSQLVNLVCREAPSKIREAGIDILLVDQNEVSGSGIADHLKIPFVSVCSSLPLNREPGVPPPFVPWAYGSSVLHELRNRVAYRLTDFLIAPIQNRANDWRRRWGLRVLRGPNDSFSPLLQLSQTVEEFDFPRRLLPGSFHAVGPFIDEKLSECPFPWEKLESSGERPIVYGSLGTLQSGNISLFQQIAEACARLPVQLVLSFGGAEIPSGIRWAGTPIVVQYAPQIALLERASLMITHAGLNTVLHCLKEGVPMVAIPITNDQPAIAARASYCGAAELLPLQKVSVDRLRDVIARVLREPSYREAARRVSAAMKAAGGAERAADLIEGLRKPRNTQPA